MQQYWEVARQQGLYGFSVADVGASFREGKDASPFMRPDIRLWNPILSLCCNQELLSVLEYSV